MNIALYILTVLIWGTTWFAITFQLEQVPISQSVFYRFAMAAIILQISSLFSRRTMRFDPLSHLYFAGLGLFLFSLNYFLFYIATQYIVSGLISVIFSLIVVMNTVLNWLFFKQRPDRYLLIGSALGILGICLLFIENLTAVKIDGLLVKGLILAITATFLASLGNMASRKLQETRIPVITANAWGMTYGALFLLIWVLYSDNPWQFSTSPPYLVSLLYLTVFGTLVAFWAYLTLLGRIGASRAAYTAVLFPLVALLLSTVWEGLDWTFLKGIGLVSILAGNVLVMRRPKSRNAG